MNSSVLLLEKAARTHSEKIAILDEECSISYSALRYKSRCVGTKLLQIIPKSSNSLNPIVVLLEKSVNAVIAFMGIQYSGNPYVPLDYGIPLARLEKILANLSPKFIVTDESGAAKLMECALNSTKVLLIEDVIDAVLDNELINSVVDLVTDSEPIYIMYTSGSTGVPKGVVIPHRGVIDYANWVVDTFEITSQEIMGNQAPFYFDNSVLDIYGALAASATLVLIPNILFTFPNKIPEYINKKGITSVFFVPTVMINIANSGVLAEVKMTSLKKVLFCGEEMPNKQLNVWRRHHPLALYANLYGPTEITDVCTYYIVNKDFEDTEPLPIGKACKNMGVCILTDGNKPAKPGELGELCVLGSGLALGYWSADENTRKVFVQNPINPYYDERMYRTGDLAYFNDDGLIVFAGRMDTQIKLGGNRIELGEIETAIKSINNVENSCVLFDKKKQEIVAVIQTKEKITLHKLKSYMLKLLPKYMLPGRLVIVDLLPLTPNDKIDRVSLMHMMENDQI